MEILFFDYKLKLAITEQELKCDAPSRKFPLLHVEHKEYYVVESPFRKKEVPA